MVTSSLKLKCSESASWLLKKARSKFLPRATRANYWPPHHDGLTIRRLLPAALYCTASLHFTTSRFNIYPRMVNMSQESCMPSWKEFQQYSQPFTLMEAKLTSHTLHREEGSGHTATIKLSPWLKLDVTNQIRTLHRHMCCHKVAITSQCPQRMSGCHLTIS